MRPSIGRIVHYVSYGTPGGEYASECRAAIITGVKNDTTADLFVMNPTGVFLNRECYMNGTKNIGTGEYLGGTWHWPERVED